MMGVLSVKYVILFTILLFIYCAPKITEPDIDVNPNNPASGLSLRKPVLISYGKSKIASGLDYTIAWTYPETIDSTASYICEIQESDKVDFSDNVTVNTTPDTSWEFFHIIEEDPVIYYYRVNIKKDNLISEWSDILSMKILPFNTPILSASKNVVLSDEEFTLLWNEIQEADSLQIYKYNNNWEQVAIVSAAVNGWIDSVYTPSIYNYRAMAYNQKDSSDWSNEVSITVKPRITLIEPNGDLNWPLGNWQGIRWTASPTIGEWVKIEYIKKGFDPNIIVSKTENDGTYNWFVPETLPKGEYKIIISSTLASKYNDESDDYFWVNQYFVSVTYPSENTTWVPKTNELITWESNINNGYLQIDLFKNSELIDTIHENADISANQYYWGIPEDIEEGSYSLKIISRDYPFVNSESPNFNITNPILELTNPTILENYLRGSELKILWNHNAMGDSVIIELSDGTNYSRINVTPNNGEYTWRIPKDITEGLYSIRLTNSNYPWIRFQSEQIINILSMPDIEISKDSLDFGEVPIDWNSSRYFFIRNKGDNNLIISEITCDNINFQIHEFSDEPIIPDDSLMIGVSFFPDDVGEFSGEIRINSNDPDEPVITINVNGTGINNNNIKYTFRISLFLPRFKKGFTKKNVNLLQVLALNQQLHFKK